jgi:signal transduction histidine kinase
MRNSLLLKLLGTFLLVIAIGSLVIYFLTSRATQNAFNLYTTRSGQVWAQRLAPVLADFYTRNGSWQGVDAILQQDFTASGNMMGGGQGRGMGPGRSPAGTGMMGALGQRLILVDVQGKVIGDTENTLGGQIFTQSQLSNGTAIIVNDQQVGTLIVTPNDIISSGTPAGQFLSSVNQAILSSAVIAGVIALALGTVLFFQITSPLRQLSRAAAAITRGDLSQQVTIHSRDELGELGQVFNSMAKSLADAELQRQHLVADVAHELRTPLTAIQGTLEGIQDGVLPMDHEQLNALHAETMLLNRLVGDLRLLSLADAGQLQLDQQAVDPTKLLSEAVERMRPQTDMKAIRLESNFAENLPTILVDSDRITQVMNNLVGNAIRYTPEGGTIRVEAAMSKSTDSLQVSVTDTGSGIPPEDLPSVFNRFYRADRSRSRASGGSGLGLAIVKQFVEAHGGSVEAQSPVVQDGLPPRQGTRITFSLPIHR